MAARKAKRGKFERWCCTARGKIESEAQWTLHDRARYLWMLKDGHFLLRDEDGIQEGDATLQLKPYLHFPGRLLWLQLNPAQQLMSVGFLAPPSKPKNVQPGCRTLPRPKSSGPARKTMSQPDPPELKPDLVVRTLNRETGKVVRESRVGLAVPQPVSSDGYTAPWRRACSPDCSKTPCCPSIRSMDSSPPLETIRTCGIWLSGPLMEEENLLNGVSSDLPPDL